MEKTADQALRDRKAAYMSAWRAKNREHRRARESEWRVKNKEAVSQWDREYYSRNRDALRLAQRAYYEQNREEAIERMRAYYAQNRAKILRRHQQRRAAKPIVEKRAYAREQARKRRARKLNGQRVRHTTPALVQARFDYYGNCCAYCGISAEKLEADHVIPLALGGLHLPANIRPACKRCNCSKADQRLHAWRSQTRR
jgi:hypothetical protein